MEVVGELVYRERQNCYALLAWTMPCPSVCGKDVGMIGECWQPSWMETPGYKRDLFPMCILLLHARSYRLILKITFSLSSNLHAFQPSFISSSPSSLSHYHLSLLQAPSCVLLFVRNLAFRLVLSSGTIQGAVLHHEPCPCFPTFIANLDHKPWTSKLALVRTDNFPWVPSNCLNSWTITDKPNCSTLPYPLLMIRRKEVAEIAQMFVVPGGMIPWMAIMVTIVQWGMQIGHVTFMSMLAKLMTSWRCSHGIPKTRRHIGKKLSGWRACQHSMVLGSLCKVGNVREAIEALSTIRKNIEASSRHYRGCSNLSSLDTFFIYALNTHRGHRGYVAARWKNPGFIKAFEASQFIEATPRPSRHFKLIYSLSRHLGRGKFVEATSRSHRGLTNSWGPHRDHRRSSRL